MNTKEIVLGAIIGTLTTVIVTTILTSTGALAKIFVTEAVKKEIAENLSTNPSFSDKLRGPKGNPGRSMPVGTIIASMLAPDDFYKGAGGDQWRLADGSSVPGTTYANDIGPSLPDLRGLFLRGLNSGRTDEWRDPDGDRPVGETQQDTVGGHAHKLDLPFTKINEWNPGHVNILAGQNKWKKLGSFDTESAGALIGSETRPNNAAVYYYVKVNLG